MINPTLSLTPDDAEEESSSSQLPIEKDMDQKKQPILKPHRPRPKVSADGFINVDLSKYHKESVLSYNSSQDDDF